jgi:hypothetical protein
VLWEAGELPKTNYSTDYAMGLAGIKPIRSGMFRAHIYSSKTPISWSRLRTVWNLPPE